MKSKHLYRFGSYSLDAEERVLLRNGQPVTLPPKDLETLLVLVERAGHIVEKEELLDRVWPGVFIEEGNLSRRIFNLRQVLGDSADERPYIETIPKRGYRFIAMLQEDADDSAAPEVVDAQTSERAQTTARLSQKKHFWLWLLALSVALALTAVLLSRHFWPLHSASPQKMMLAVLPFENLSGDAHEDYFADGLTEEMIAQLGQLQPAKLGVIARTSIMRYRGTKETVAQIGRELGVRYLLEGSVRRGGERVRVTAQLIQVGEQTHLWAETYERPLTDVLNIQTEIAEKITHSLSIQLLPVAANSSASSHVNFESYDRYLLGLHELGEGTRESVNKAIQYFQEGIAKDPKDARLYSVLGEAYEALNTYYSSPTEMMPRVKAAALQALQLDPNLASAHVLLGDVHLLFDWDWPAAEAEYRRALEINPSLPEAQLGYATYLGTLGRFEEALSRVQQAYIFDPLAIDSRNDALWIYYFSGRMSETVQQCQKAIELEPAAGLPYAMLATAYAQMGKRAEALRAAEDAIRFANSPSVITTTASALAHVGQSDEAKQLLSKALKQAKERYVCRYIVGATYAELGEKEQALESLEQGYLQRST
ncbi:MAG TPA: winged helix-turn-helix domain-containing protein [Terriglobales bacterium]|nr:winged helix-turn-helix domain-containing protein [Terriglobales bacterium]